MKSLIFIAALIVLSTASFSISHADSSYEIPQKDFAMICTGAQGRFAVSFKLGKIGVGTLESFGSTDLAQGREFTRAMQNFSEADVTDAYIAPGKVEIRARKQQGNLESYLMFVTRGEEEMAGRAFSGLFTYMEVDTKTSKSANAESLDLNCSFTKY